MPSLLRTVVLTCLLHRFVRNIKSAVLRQYTVVHRKSVFLVADKMVVINYKEDVDLKAVRNKGFHENWKKLKDVCCLNGLSDINADGIVNRCKDGCISTGQVFEELKMQSKKECMKGKGNVIDKLTLKAAANFRKALELRSVCDYIWVHVLENKGDAGHAQFQKNLNLFLAYCCDPKLWGKPKRDIENLIMALDLDLSPSHPAAAHI